MFFFFFVCLECRVRICIFFFFAFFLKETGRSRYATDKSLGYAVMYCRLDKIDSMLANSGSLILRRTQTAYFRGFCEENRQETKRDEKDEPE